MNIIFLGAPGAGKGSQSAFIVEKYHIPHIATGDIFREAIKNKTELGVKAKEFMDNGQLVPDELTDSLVAERLAQPDASKGFLLDGYPRSLSQAKTLDEVLQRMDKEIDYVINIDIPFDVLSNRIVKRRICKDCGATYHLEYNPSKVDGICDKCGGELYQRSDDNEATVEKRLATYTSQTQPLIDYYIDKNKLVNVNGLQELDEVFNDIKKFLEELK